MKIYRFIKIYYTLISMLFDRNLYKAINHNIIMEKQITNEELEKANIVEHKRPYWKIKELDKKMIKQKEGNIIIELKEKEIKHLLKEGVLFEPKPNKFQFLDKQEYIFIEQIED